MKIKYLRVDISCLHLTTGNLDSAVECKRAEEKLSRKESYRIRDASLKIVDRSLSLGKNKGRVNWNERNKLVLSHVAPSLEDLQAKFDEDRTSIGLIKPAEVLEFYRKGDLQIYKDPKVFQQSLFGTKIPEIEEIPHLFGYRFRCNGCQLGKEHNIQCEDWELLESYRRWGMQYGDLNLLWEKLQINIINRWWAVTSTSMLEHFLNFQRG